MGRKKGPGDEYFVLIDGRFSFRIKGDEKEVIDLCKESTLREHGENVDLRISKMNGPGLHGSLCVFAGRAGDYS